MDAIETRVADLNPLEDEAHSKPRPVLEQLSDQELLQAARNPKDGKHLVRNTRTGNLVDGNGRAHELLRRVKDPNSSIGPDTLVPVEDYSPDVSMFPDLD